MGQPVIADGPGGLLNRHLIDGLKFGFFGRGGVGNTNEVNKYIGPISGGGVGGGIKGIANDQLAAGRQFMFRTFPYQRFNAESAGLLQGFYEPRTNVSGSARNKNG